MVCKEEVVTLFKEFSSYKRVDLMCTLLNMCLPFELRFLGTCLEELGKRDYSQLRESESRANNQAELADVTCVADKHTRRILTVYLSLLHSTNQACSNMIFKTLASLAQDDYNEVIQLLRGAASDDSPEDNTLEEMLLLYTMALNHPAFSFEEKAVLGNILLRLQEEEDKRVYPQKRALVCVKTGMPSMYMPCTPCTITPDGTGAQHFPIPGKPYHLLPATAVATGDGSKGLQEMPGPYFLTTSMFCSMPPPNIVSPVPAPAGASSEFAICQTAPYTVPAMSQPLCHQPDLVAATVNNQYPVNEPLSPYASPTASPTRSPDASRCESPVWNTNSGQPTTNYKNCYTSPNHNETSSSSSTCSGGSTAGGGGNSFRGSRSNNHLRSKQAMQNGQATMEEPSSISPVKMEPLRITSDETLPDMMSTMTLGAVNGVTDPIRGHRVHGDDKRCWSTAGPPLVPQTGSAGSSQSGTPSPPGTPSEQWENYKEESSVAPRWDKGPRGIAGVSNSQARFNAHLRGPPLRRNIHLDQKVQDTRRQTAQPPMIHSSYILPALQHVQGNNTAYYPQSPFYFPLMPAPGAASGPASYPTSFAPNGNIPPPPPEYMSMPPASQKSPPPFTTMQQQHFIPAKHNSSHFVQSNMFPHVMTSQSNKDTCFNCGGVGHRGNDCSDPSIQDVLKKGMYHLDYSSPQSSDASAAPAVILGSGGSSTPQSAPPALEK
ncbi:uncharacterized protein LOC132195227 isoform X2 [Neocloeon triangulifer]|uniref:uncharacterized protein LOC132195227 isoform X2 n=1 Tax=Neocloeon triangulifer TaxID=2078957 RepID=UPI00286F01BF|nr:uncharacterized protein LOC132195227 isoform X2 [Neocloeon triangulifer]